MSNDDAGRSPTNLRRPVGLMEAHFLSDEQDHGRTRAFQCGAPGGRDWGATAGGRIESGGGAMLTTTRQ
jgi:hypothetical protein